MEGSSAIGPNEWGSGDDNQDQVSNYCTMCISIVTLLYNKYYMYFSVILEYMYLHIIQHIQSILRIVSMTGVGTSLIVLPITFVSYLSVK